MHAPRVELDDNRQGALQGGKESLHCEVEGFYSLSPRELLTFVTVAVRVQMCVPDNHAITWHMRSNCKQRVQTKMPATQGVKQCARVAVESVVQQVGLGAPPARVLCVVTCGVLAFLAVRTCCFGEDHNRGARYCLCYKFIRVCSAIEPRLCMRPQRKPHEPARTGWAVGALSVHPVTGSAARGVREAGGSRLTR